MQEKSQIFRYFISIAIKEAAIGRHGHPAKQKKDTQLDVFWCPPRDSNPGPTD